MGASGQQWVLVGVGATGKWAQERGGKERRRGVTRHGGWAREGGAEPPRGGLKAHLTSLLLHPGPCLEFP